MWDVPMEIELLTQDLSELVTKKEECVITKEDKLTAKDILKTLESLTIWGSAVEDILDIELFEEWYDEIVK